MKFCFMPQLLRCVCFIVSLSASVLFAEGHPCEQKNAAETILRFISLVPNPDKALIDAQKVLVTSNDKQALALARDIGALVKRPVITSQIVSKKSKTKQKDLNDNALVKICISAVTQIVKLSGKADPDYVGIAPELVNEFEKFLNQIDTKNSTIIVFVIICL